MFFSCHRITFFKKMFDQRILSDGFSNLIVTTVCFWFFHDFTSTLVNVNINEFMFAPLLLLLYDFPLKNRKMKLKRWIFKVFCPSAGFNVSMHMIWQMEPLVLPWISKHLVPPSGHYRPVSPSSLVVSGPWEWSWLPELLLLSWKPALCFKNESLQSCQYHSFQCSQDEK